MAGEKCCNVCGWAGDDCVCRTECKATTELRKLRETFRVKETAARNLSESPFIPADERRDNYIRAMIWMRAGVLTEFAIGGVTAGSQSDAREATP